MLAAPCRASPSTGPPSATALPQLQLQPVLGVLLRLNMQLNGCTCSAAVLTAVHLRGSCKPEHLHLCHRMLRPAIPSPSASWTCGFACPAAARVSRVACQKWEGNGSSGLGNRQAVPTKHVCTLGVCREAAWQPANVLLVWKKSAASWVGVLTLGTGWFGANHPESWVRLSRWAQTIWSCMLPYSMSSLISKSSTGC